MYCMYVLREKCVLLSDISHDAVQEDLIGLLPGRFCLGGNVLRKNLKEGKA